MKFIDPSGHARINSYDVMVLELVLNEAMKFQSTKSEGWWRWRGYLGTEFAPVFNEADNNRFKYLYSLLTQTNSGNHSSGRAEWAKGQLLDSYAEYKQDEYNEVLAYAIVGSIGGIANSKGTGNTSTLRSQEKPYVNHTTVQKTITFRSLKTTGTPNSSVDLYDENSKLIQRKYYDKNGRAKEDIDYEHSNGDNSHAFLHRHTWNWSSGTPERSGH
ncbi:hypothetical protein QP775_17440 [Paenibacillus sp. UMB4589-SE434]|nr:hypothetical protein [Paenibacillus sp. UMB4589-SE434]